MRRMNSEHFFETLFSKQGSLIKLKRGGHLYNTGDKSIKFDLKARLNLQKSNSKWVIGLNVKLIKWLRYII